MPLPNNLEHMQAMFDNMFAIQKVTVSFGGHQLARIGRHFGMKMWPSDYHPLVNDVFGEGSEAAALILRAADESFENRMEEEAEAQTLLRHYESAI